jgi:hypothetical protein
MRLRFVSEPGADRGPRAGIPRGVVDATGSRLHLGDATQPFLLPAEAGALNKTYVIPVLRSLRSHKHPTRDAHADPLRGLNSVAAPRRAECENPQRSESYSSTACLNWAVSVYC